jgi:hypothetical protein
VYTCPSSASTQKKPLCSLTTRPNNTCAKSYLPYATLPCIIVLEIGAGE